ncbi:oligosaccharide flippase family protein [Paramagnetospirillum magneticum]|uniref:Membrane protein involved in the export of O-antigen and teichoic acid n=1 Tax=Paramagnetospirillum magneticum (strain ATCC 700264 / AMB-1) TaxID=342108 RepID=Q2W7C6_PARM1|nr:oligosaccharide flippase family protein [Paramagnetospirillum magneticum]BAE50249.1 Membrane protein involved in the export of O-antigen and teichoic acid [Paramagnetospirillum magneticum AMB-1]
MSLDIARSLRWSYGGMAANLVLQVAFAALAARLVSAESYGMAAVATGLVSYLSYLSDLGVGLLAVRNRDLDAADLWGVALVGLAGNLVIVAAVWLAAPSVAAFVGFSGEGVWVLRALSLLAPLGGLNTAALAWLNREMDFRALAIMSLVGKLVGQGAVTLPLAWAGWGVWALVAGALGQVAAGLAIALWRQPPRLPRRSRWPAIGAALRVGVNFSLIRLLDSTQAQMIPLSAATLMGAGAAGLFDRGALLTLVALELITAGAGRVLLPVYGRMGEEERGRIPQAFLSACRRVLCLVLPLAAGVAAAAEPLVLTVFGGGWSALVEPLRLLAVLAGLRSVAMLAGGLVEAQGGLYHNMMQRICVLVLLLSWICVVRPTELGWLLAGAVLAEGASALALLALASRAAGLAFAAVLVPPLLALSVALPVGGVMALAAGADGSPGYRLVLTMLCGGICLGGVLLLHPHSGLRGEVRRMVRHAFAGNVSL